MRRRNTIPLGRILGIPVGVDYSWFLIFVLLTWMLAMNYFPHEFGNWSAFEYWGVAAVTTIMLFVSVLLHELGHSTVAMRYDIEVRSITLFIFGGLAEIKKEPPKASAEFWIAIAGPIVSFLLAGIFFLIERATGTLPALWAITKYLALINFILAVFNLEVGS